MLPRISVLLFFYAIFFQAIPVDASNYPMEMELVKKSDARYDTPENSYIAIMSAMVNDDIEWYYNGLTRKSAENEITQYKEYNFNIQEEFDSVKNINKIFVLDKKKYKEGVVLIIKTIDNDGSIFTGPSVFMQEDGLWKAMQEISADDPILDYLEYTPPPEYLTLWGPQKLTINKWHYLRSSHLFRVDTPGEGKLTITKATLDKRIKNGFLFFNYRRIPLRNFFRGDEDTLEKKIVLRSKNKIILFLRGTPGAAITLKIEQKKE